MCGLIRALAQIDNQNEYFIFLKAHNRNLLGEFSMPLNMSFVHLPNLIGHRPPRLLWQHLGAGFHGRHYHLDIWHGLHYSLPDFIGSMRTVSTFHDVAFFLYPHLYPLTKRFYFRHAIVRALAAADAVVSVSHSTADEVRRLFDGQGSASGFDAGKLHVVHSGVDDKFFSPVSDTQMRQVRERYALTAPYILFLGTGEKRKNLPLLIRAFSRLRERGHRDLLLVLAGQPCNGRSEAEKAIAAENLGNSVRRLGYVPDADVLPLYHGAKLFALPSVHEGFGFPILEAMACGVPVLAADNSAMREIVANAGMLCSGDAQAWAQKMARLLEDANLRQKLADCGRRRAKEFSWQQTAQATLAVYESLQSAPRRALPLNSSLVLEPHPALSAMPRNGASNGTTKLLSRAGTNGADIDLAVLKTLAYADLFDYPLDAEEIYHGLFACDASFPAVKTALQNWKTRGLIQQNGRFFFIRGRTKIVGLRQQRREYSRHLLQKHAWLLRLITKFPFVRSVALSGASVFENCKKNDDIDLFILTASHRLWTVYAGLVVLLKSLGKRKTVCINCLLDLDHFGIDDRDFFVAHQIAFLQPLSGTEHFQKFQLANSWIREYLPQSPLRSPDGSSGKLIASSASSMMPSASSWLKKAIEKILSWRIFDYLEHRIFQLYRRRIHNLTGHLSPDSVVVQPGRIKLFTNNHRHRVTNALQLRLQEILRHHRSHEEVEESHAVV
jgi:glycosyltransferase involved in cell wall biosynthesis